MSPDVLKMEPQAPNVVTMIGTGDGGITPQLVKTPAGQPDLRIQIISPVVGITSRFVVTFLGSVVGLIGAGSASTIIPAHDFMDLFWKCCQLSLGAAIVGLCKDLVTIFTKLSNKFPLLDA